MSNNDGPAYYYRFSRLYEMHFSLPPFAAWVENNHASLLACLPEQIDGRVLDIGGPDILSYREIMEFMAEALRLPRPY